MSSSLFIGVMSGTSLDGVDAALVEMRGDAPPLLRGKCYSEYSVELRSAISALLTPELPNELDLAARLGNRLAQQYAATIAQVLRDAGVAAGNIAAIGCHGQTIRHHPQAGYTLQLGNPALLAELTGITTVADFRSRDIAAGGQGAPLVPAFHDAVFRSDECHRVILNLGGIANLTDLAPGKPTRGFDCGPGNLLLDAWTQKQLGVPYDADGVWAQGGTVRQDLLARLMQHPFFTQTPPKSCGFEEFNPRWLEGQLRGDEAARDVQATLCALTVNAAADAVAAYCGTVDELYVCGGGAHNQALMQALATRLATARVDTTAALGIDPDWVEAIAFAWLAHRVLSGLPGNLPAVTGARGPRLLGAIYPA